MSESSSECHSSDEDGGFIESDKEIDGLVCSTDEMLQVKIERADEEEEKVNMVFDNPYKINNSLIK